tara:strand:+ start:480 stop:950 length:471 start_codon:yes stop_codon:yes gene_type:complete
MNKITQKIIKIDMLETSSENLSPEHKQERAIAIYDLIENNFFELKDHDGPYQLFLAKETRHLLFDVRSQENQTLNSFYLAMGPFRRLIKDYKQVCENYYEAIRTKPPSQIQAVDVGRKALHDEGATLVIERLDGKILMDNETARRIFTLICILRSR